MKKGVEFFLIVILIFTLSFISAIEVEDSLHLNIQVTNSSNDIVTGTFVFVFNISSSSSCNNIVYTDSATLTTDSRGSISYYLENVNLNYSEQYWLCYYRNGILINASKIARVPYAFRAKNVTLSGVEIDTNLNLGGYNVTASIGNFGVQVSNYALNVMGNVNITGNITLGEKINGVTLPPPTCSGTEKLTFDGTSFSCSVDILGSGGSGIIASVSNASRSYLQFADGTMIETINYIGTMSSSVFTAIPIPQPFIDRNYSVSALWDYQTSATGDFVFTDGGLNNASYVHLRDSTVNAANGHLRIVLIGRWTTLTNITQNTTSWAVNGNGDTVLFDTTKKVGIGTASPTQRLDILGNVNISGNLYINGSLFGGSGTGVPTGAIVAFNQASCPTGWTLADGTSGTPDLRGIFVRGSGANSILKYANGSYFSIGYGTYQNDSMQGHRHLWSGYNAVPGSGTNSAPFNVINIADQDQGIIKNPVTDNVNGVPRTGAETRPAYYATIYCVKTAEDTSVSNTIWGTSGDSIIQNNISKSVSVTAIGGNFLQVQDRQPSGTSEQPASAAAWLNRTLNIVMTNEISGASLSSNNISITLPAGTYFVEATSPTAQEQSLQITSQARVFDITHNIALLNGTTTYGQVATGSYVLIQNAVNGRFTLSSASSISLQQWMGAIPTSGGWGQDAALASGNIYSNLMLWKIS